MKQKQSNKSINQTLDRHGEARQDHEQMAFDQRTTFAILEQLKTKMLDVIYISAIS